MSTPTRTRAQNTSITLAGKAEQTITLETSNSLRKFNRPTSVDVRGSGSIVRPLNGSAFSAGLLAKLGTVQTITDELGGPTAFNACLHVKEHWECPPLVVTAKTRCNAPYQNGTEVKTKFEVGAQIACNLNLNMVPFMGSDEELRAECLSQMNPKVIPRGMDLSQQVGEALEGLKAVKQILGNVANMCLDISRLNAWNSPRVRRLLGNKTFEQMTLGNWLDLGVAAGLSYRLAIAPTVDACKQLVSAMERETEAYKRILDSVQVLHGNAYREASYTSSSGNDYHTWNNTRLYTTHVVCTAKVKFHSAKTQSLYEAFLVQYYGIKPSLATAWELTPLSFVVDWFWNFGKYLDRHLRTPIADISYTVIHTGWSRKDTVRSEGTVNVCAGIFGVGLKDTGEPLPVTGTCTKSTYKRELISLDLEGGGIIPAPKFRLPSAGQLTTLVGLLIAIGRGRNEIFRVFKPGRQ